jgi:EAL domain-containing protein (putative c-di-GMP-specific phosphodiesterase class I)
MVGIGKSLGFLIVAEGVETKQQADFLKLIGCTHAQGYLYGKPMPLEAMKKLMMEE